MYKIKTRDCNFTLVPLKYIHQNNYTSIGQVYDVNRHTERLIRLLIFQGIKDITIHTDTYENKEGWAYTLHLLFNGLYATEFTPKGDFKDL